MAYGAKDPIRSLQIPWDPAVEVVHTAHRPEPAMVGSVGFTSTSSKYWSVVGGYRDDERLWEPSFSSY